MILPYAMRLACLCLELLFLVNLSAAILALVCSPLAARAAETLQSQRAALLFLGLRLLPFVLAMGATTLLCAPSYLRFEDNPGSEFVGPFCLVMAAGGLALCASAAARGIGAMRQLVLLDRHLGNAQTRPSFLEGTEMRVAQQDDSGAPLLALVGILRPRLIASPRLLKVLSAPQLEAAMRHEQAHLQRRDNLKRLLIAVAPGALPFVGGFGLIERQWKHHAELAADDAATCGQPGTAVALAEALMHVARLGNGTPPMPLASSLSATDGELARRVNRLLRSETAAPAQPPNRLANRAWPVVGMALSAAVLCTLPQLSQAIYPLLEILLR